MPKQMLQHLLRMCFVMRMCLCIWACHCMSICFVYVRARVHVQVCMCMLLHVHMYVHLCICACYCMCICMCTCITIFCLGFCLYSSHADFNCNYGRPPRELAGFFGRDTSRHGVVSDACDSWRINGRPSQELAGGLVTRTRSDTSKEAT